MSFSPVTLLPYGFNGRAAQKLTKSDSFVSQKIVRSMSAILTRGISGMRFKFSVKSTSVLLEIFGKTATTSLFRGKMSLITSSSSDLISLGQKHIILCCNISNILNIQYSVCHILIVTCYTIDKFIRLF